MVRFDALVTAGGKGSRLDTDQEKPLVEVGGKPMVRRVLDALGSCDLVGEKVASVSDNSPKTRAYLKRWGVRLVETEGEDYVPDLRAALGQMRGDSVLVVPADLPLLSGTDLDQLLNGYMQDPKEAVMVAVPLRVVRSLGARPSHVFDLDGKEMVYTGVSVIHRQGIVDGRYLEEGWVVSESPGLAINVNSLEDLDVAEGSLSQSMSESNDS